MSGPETRFVRALLAQAGPGARLIEAESRPWLAATFAGVRHRLLVAVRSPAGALAAALAGHEWDLPGQLVIELTAAARPGTDGGALLAIEALTVVTGSSGQERSPRASRSPAMTVPAPLTSAPYPA